MGPSRKERLVSMVDLTGGGKGSAPVDVLVWLRTTWRQRRATANGSSRRSPARRDHRVAQRDSMESRPHSWPTRGYTPPGHADHIHRQLLGRWTNQPTRRPDGPDSRQRSDGPDGRPPHQPSSFPPPPARCDDFHVKHTTVPHASTTFPPSLVVQTCPRFRS